MDEQTESKMNKSWKFWLSIFCLEKTEQKNKIVSNFE